MDEISCYSKKETVGAVVLLVQTNGHAKTVNEASQKVGHHIAVINHPSALGDCVEDLEVVLALLVDLHDGRYITTAVAVVRSGPDGDKVGILEPKLEAIHNKLMGASNKIQVVDVVELCSNFGPEKPASTSRRDSPSVDVIRV